MNATTKKYQKLLGELDNLPASGEVLVNRDREAFVGHGDRVGAWTMALPLKKKNDNGQNTTPLKPSDTYRAVGDDLSSLSEADLLAPGQRLRELHITPMLVVSGKGLREHRNEPLGQEILPENATRPASGVSRETMQHVMDRSQEWVRHFQRCSVAGWDSDLVVSTFLHVGCDDRTLYLEWNAYCLFPVSPAHRMAGTFDTSTSRSALLALRELIRLPGSMRFRGRSAFATLVEAVTMNPTPGPFGYGSVRSIREIAAGDRCFSEFQDLDGQRYIKLLERRTLSAVHRHLSEKGYATEELESRINTVVNNTTLIRGGQFTGAQNFGAGGSASTENATTDNTGEETK